MKKEIRLRLIRDRICINCWKTLDASEVRTQCSTCSEKNAKRARDREAKSKKAGLCQRCHKKFATKPYHYCEECRIQKNESSKKSNHKLRDEVFAAYGNKCACLPCGENNPYFLVLDHVNGGGNKHRKEIRHRSSWSICRWAKEQNFPSMLRLLCFNCNGGRERNDGICPHKSIG